VGFTETTLCFSYHYINWQAFYLENTCGHTINGTGPVSLQFWFHIYFFSVTLRFQLRVMASPYGASRSHSLYTPHPVGLLWTSDQPDTETSPLQHTTLTRDKHPCPGEIRIHNPSKWAATDPRLRPQGHSDWLLILYAWIKSYVKREAVVEWSWPQNGYSSKTFPSDRMPAEHSHSRWCSINR
jgi:hypothetical protein